MSIIERYGHYISRYAGLLIIFYCLLSTNQSIAQDVNLRFQHITSDNGLSQNTVDCILKDSRGFMWFGTWNGLNRFDGYNFVVYKSEANEQSLSNNFIYSICEDHNHDLWVGTKYGLNKFDYTHNKFIRFYHEKADKNTIAGNWIKVVYCDSKGNIWAGTAEDGLDLITTNSAEPTKIKIRHFGYNEGSSSTLPDNHINCIMEDRSGAIWIGTRNGLVKLLPDYTVDTIYRSVQGSINALSYNDISSLFEDRQGKIWIGTQFGLNKFDPVKKTFAQYYFNPDNERSISHFVINDIKEDLQGNILVGTLGGLNKYNPETNDFIRFPQNQNDDYSLNNEFINCIYSDNQGNIWIGTDKGGINKYSIYQKQFGYFIHQPANNNSLSNNTINSLYDEPENLWIGTAGGGLNRYNKISHKFTAYTYNPHNNKGINSNFITSILRDKNNNLWIGTWGGGLNKAISLAGEGDYKKYIYSPGINSLCNVYVSSILEDSNGDLFIGTLGGVDYFNPKSETFVHIANNPEWKNVISEVGCILKDKKGNIWIGTRLGLYKIGAGKNYETLQDIDITRYINIPGNVNSLPGNYVISLHEDSSGTIWVGTYGNGIAKIVKASDNSLIFKQYTEKDGLSNNVIYSILEDDHKNLWLSTDYGLSRFDTHTEEFKNYFVTDGLQSNQFYWSAACKSSNGKMFFGGMKGVNFFVPDSIKDDTFTPVTVITDFKIFNGSVNIGQWNKKKVILEKPVYLTKEIRLSYKENVFSFEFSALDYFLPDKIKYAYKMDGVDNDWVNVTANRRFANYTNLKGGEYTFIVKASNSDGKWNDTPTTLKIIITPPFWATIWFKIILFAFISLIVIAYFTIRTRTLRVQKRKLELTVKERTARIQEQNEQLALQAKQLTETNLQLAHRQELIEGQKDQLELQNKEISEQRDKLIELNKRVQLVNQLKLRFFTNISHEFRTPLTLILGPLERLIKSGKTDNEQLTTLQLINRNAQRLLHLINQLMDFRKVETGKLNLKVSKGNIFEFLKNIFSMFSQLAEQRNIKYTFKYVEGDNDHWFDHEKVENIVFNLLSNAFKYTPEGGSITLDVQYIQHIQSNEKVIEIKISDTGIGIPYEHQGHIFKRFYQINTPENLKRRGSGVGLSLTKELVKAHHGQISVESVPNAGSVFTIHLPCFKNQFDGQEIITDPYSPNSNLDEQVLNLSEVLSAENETIDYRVEKKSEPNSSDKPLLVVAEDNHDLREFISVHLRDEFEILETDNGKDGYEMAKAHDPDLIISDIMMPEMDGLELCSRVKNNIITSHIPLILLTARTTVENWIEGLESGADDYIPKPFNIEILKARIKNLIETRRKLKKIFQNELTPEITKITTTSVDEQFLRKAIEIVEKHYSNSTFGVEEFVEKMAVSRSLLHKKLSAITDQSAGDFITTVRLKKSIELLQTRQGNISEIAYDVGFNDPKYFSRIFKKHFGVTPSEYVQKRHEKV